MLMRLLFRLLQVQQYCLLYQKFWIRLFFRLMLLMGMLFSIQRNLFGKVIVLLSLILVNIREYFVVMLDVGLEGMIFQWLWVFILILNSFFFCLLKLQCKVRLLLGICIVGQLLLLFGVMVVNFNVVFFVLMCIYLLFFLFREVGVLFSLVKVLALLLVMVVNFSLFFVVFMCIYCLFCFVQLFGVFDRVVKEVLLFVLEFVIKQLLVLKAR